MLGFILNITKSVREDLFVKILTNHAYYNLYRFYGARHSILHIGRKIDFEIQDDGIFVPKLRSILHVMNKFERDIHKISIWQKFCFLLDRHLHEVHEISDFYYNLLDINALHLQKQDAKRVVTNMFLEILFFEGRIYDNDRCFNCNAVLKNKVALTKSFMLACPNCIIDPYIFDLGKIKESFELQNLVNFDDNEIDNIYEIMLYGF